MDNRTSVVNAVSKAEGMASTTLTELDTYINDSFDRLKNGDIVNGKQTPLSEEKLYNLRIEVSTLYNNLGSLKAKLKGTVSYHGTQMHPEYSYLNRLSEAVDYMLRIGNSEQAIAVYYELLMKRQRMNALTRAINNKIDRKYN